MKRSDITRIIREEIIKALRGQINEAFGDPIAAKLNKMTGMDGRWRNFWASAARTYDIAWDKLPKGSFRKVSTSDPATKKGMVFWIATSEKDTPGAQWSWDRVKPGVVAVTIDGKPQYYQGSSYRNTGSRIGTKGPRSGDAIGQGVRGTMQFKKLPTYSDFAYVFDLDSYRGGTKELKAKRAELKLGKDKFTDHNAWKKENLARYKAMLADKVGSRGAVERMTAEIVKAANEAVDEAMKVTKVDDYGELLTTVAGKDVRLASVTRAMSNALEAFSRYIRSENRNAEFLKRYPEYQGTSDSYETGNMRNQALDIKEYLNMFKTGKFRY